MNVALNSWKFIFTLLVVCHHSAGSFPPEHFIRGYLAVEFFFMLSGFFLANTCIKHKITSPYSWWVRRVKKIYPIFLYSLAILFILKFAFSNENFLDFCANNEAILYEALFLNRSGFSFYTINAPDWYISCLLLAGFFYVSLLHFGEKYLAPLIIPIIILISGTYINSTYGYLDVHSKLILNIIDIGMIRAFMDMGLGILLYYSLDHPWPLKNNIYISSIFELITTALLCYLLINNHHSPYDLLVLPVFMILIFSSYKCRGVVTIFLSTSFFRFINKFSLYLYLTHIIVIQYGKYVLNDYWSISTYFLLSLVFALCSYYFVQVVMFLLKKLWDLSAVPYLLRKQ